MKPDATQYNPDADYLRDLLKRSGLSQRAAAATIGLSAAGFQNYIRKPDDKKYRKAPYTVQFALEALANEAGQSGDKQSRGE
jgi:predicted transcriptional regulator